MISVNHEPFDKNHPHIIIILANIKRPTQESGHCWCGENLPFDGFKTKYISNEQVCSTANVNVEAWYGKFEIPFLPHNCILFKWRWAIIKLSNDSVHL